MKKYIVEFHGFAFIEAENELEAEISFDLEECDCEWTVDYVGESDKFPV